MRQILCFLLQTWNLSKILHDRIFGPKILHTKSAYNASFFATIKQRLCEHWWSLLLKLKWIVIISIVLKEMCVKLPKSCVNFIFLCKFDKELRCFLEKFTQLGKILHDRRSRRSRQISSLTQIWHLLLFLILLFAFLYIFKRGAVT